MWRDGEGKRVCSKCGTVRLAGVERCPECGTKRSRNALYEQNPNRPPQVKRFWDLPVEEREKVHLSLLIAADKDFTVQQWADLLFDEMLCPWFPNAEKWFDTFFSVLNNSGIQAVDKRWYETKADSGMNPFTHLPWGRWSPPSARKQQQQQNSNDSGGACLATGCLLIVIVFALGMCALGGR